MYRIHEYTSLANTYVHSSSAVRLRRADSLRGGGACNQALSQLQVTMSKITMCVWVATAAIVAAASAMPMTGTIDEASILANGGDPASQETKDVRALSLFASCLLLIHIHIPNSEQPAMSPHCATTHHLPRLRSCAPIARDRESMRDLALNFPYLCSVWIIHESQSFVVDVRAWWVGVGVVGAREKIILDPTPSLVCGWSDSEITAPQVLQRSSASHDP